MARTTLAITMLCPPRTALAQDVHIVHCLAGCPAGTPGTNDLVVRGTYALSNNGKTRFADRVADRVTRETIGTGASFDRAWRDDELLDADDTLEADDDDGAFPALRTDRAHQAARSETGALKTTRHTTLPRPRSRTALATRSSAATREAIGLSNAESSCSSGPTTCTNTSALARSSGDNARRAWFGSVPSGALLSLEQR